MRAHAGSNAGFAVEHGSHAHHSQARRDAQWFPFGFGAATASHRLFCLPYAGGGASFFLPWRKSLHGVAIAPVQYPGRETRLGEPCYEDLQRMVEDLAEVILPHLDRPYFLLGYSLGARIGFALCHRLAELGAPLPEMFIPTAHSAPDAPPMLAGAHRLPDAELFAHIRRYGGMSELVLQNPELMEMILPALRADIGLVEHKVPSSPLPCSILAYAGTEDEAASPISMGEWQRFATAEFRSRSFPGGHFFAKTASEFLPTLARDIARF